MSNLYRFLGIDENFYFLIRRFTDAWCTDPVIPFLGILYGENWCKAAEEHLVIFNGVEQDFFVRRLERRGRCAGGKKKKEEGGNEEESFFEIFIHGLAGAELSEKVSGQQIGTLRREEETAHFVLSGSTAQPVIGQVVQPDKTTSSIRAITSSALRREESIRIASSARTSGAMVRS